jgi:hypothetical protein
MDPKNQIAKNSKLKRTDLAEGLEKDPRFDEIKTGILEDWKKRTGKEINSPEGIDFRLGEMGVKNPVTLDDLAKNEFRKRFPEDSRDYDKLEKTRIYTDPSDDPEYQKTQVGILAKVNKEEKEYRDRNPLENYSEVWNMTYNRISRDEWRSFVNRFPEKAGAYRDRNSSINEALEFKSERERQQGVSETPTEQAGPVLVLITTPSLPIDSQEAINAQEETKNIRETLTKSGPSGLNGDDLQKIANDNNIPIEGLDTFEEGSIDTAINLHARGVSSEETTKVAIDAGPAQNKLNQSAFLQNLFEIADPKQTQSLQQAAGFPRLSVWAQDEMPIEPRPNQLFLKYIDNKYLPALEKIQGYSDRAKGFVLDKFKEGGKKFADKFLSESGKKIVSAAAKKAGQLAIKAGIKAAVTAGVGATTGVATGGISLVIAAVGKVLQKTLGAFFKKTFSKLLQVITGEKDTGKQLVTFFLGLAGLMFIAGLGPIAFIPLALGGGILIIGQGVGSLAGAAGSAIGATIYGLAALTASVAVTPLLIVMIGFPLAVVFILFIINSGAFVVPYGGFGGTIVGGESLYIRVEKEANPTGNLPNSSTTVSYEITFTAISESLSEVTISETCRVAPDSSVSCPTPENIRAGNQSTPEDQRTQYDQLDDITSQEIGVISPTDPFVITYTRSFNGGTFGYADSRVTDTMTVTATVTSGSDSASGSASICFGDCPTGCFEIVDESSWPSNYLGNLQGAITELVSLHPLYVDKVCAGTSVPICYNPVSVGYWGCHNHFGNLVSCPVTSNYTECDITLYSGGLNSVSNGVYILAHEAAHHLDAISSYYSQYASYPGTIDELPLCSYSATASCPNGHCAEGFAESIALYARLPSYWSSPTYCGTTAPYQSLYPSSYQFVEDIIYEE